MTETGPKHEVIFVYNADSGALPSLKDYVHKIVKPSTYPCNLCAVTYNNFGFKNKDWRKFIENLGIKVKFLHKDEFLKLGKMETVDFPAVFEQRGSKLVRLISNHEINKCKTLKELEDLVLTKIKNIL
jgi:hypothetical protein